MSPQRPEICSAASSGYQHNTCAGLCLVESPQPALCSILQAHTLVFSLFSSNGAGYELAETTDAPSWLAWESTAAIVGPHLPIPSTSTSTSPTFRQDRRQSRKLAKLAAIPLPNPQADLNCRFAKSSSAQVPGQSWSWSRRPR
ncbi:hypothetical protein TrVFT333_011726 [Trichoderma virens FT-333]|nr:hypothetical protein TrVFT333_011726 [Trichoderma virens FT-333]